VTATHNDAVAMKAVTAVPGRQWRRRSGGRLIVDTRFSPSTPYLNATDAQANQSWPERDEEKQAWANRVWVWIWPQASLRHNDYQQ